MNHLTAEETRYIILLLSQTIERMDARIAYYQGNVCSGEFIDMCDRRRAVKSIIAKLKSQVSMLVSNPPDESYCGRNTQFTHKFCVSRGASTPP